MKPAKRMESIPPSSTLRVLGLAKELERQGKKIIHMEVGEPDFDTPAHIKKAAEEALARGMTKYTPSAGLPELREAVAEHLATKGIKTTAKNIIITPGAKHAIFCAMAATLDPGDEVIIPSPCWTYEAMVRIVGGKPVFVKTSAENGFKLKVEDVQKMLTPKTRMLLLNYPNNPTGAVMRQREIRPLVDLATDRKLWVLSDEIYDCLVYEGEHASPMSFPGMAERTIYINGFSKAYAMTGWRLGYAAAPAELIAEMSKIQEASTSCVAGFVQAAGIAALRGPQGFITEMREEYKRRRDEIVKGLSSIDGIDCAKPEGAFYAFPVIKKLGIPSLEFCEVLLREAGVAAVPGSGFGPYGEGHVRFSYATSMENIKQAIKRVGEVVGSLRSHK
ncbi:MAG: pyridoxal phosphate-dependent aminotransferase [Candidatus Hodarchaeaceae archaeon]|nr:pyridoxal phosphate-dependent aminotransferase [Candidatus Hodarchaeaceae archaeon]